MFEKIKELLDVLHSAAAAGPQFSAIITEVQTELLALNAELMKTQSDRAAKKAEEEAKKAAAEASKPVAGPTGPSNQRSDGMPTSTSAPQAALDPGRRL